MIMISTSALPQTMHAVLDEKMYSNFLKLRLSQLSLRISHTTGMPRSGKAHLGNSSFSDKRLSLQEQKTATVLGHPAVHESRNHLDLVQFRLL